jgi:hypothetical protein
MKPIAIGLSILCAGAALASSETAQAAQVSQACTVAEVATFDNRIHIHCTPDLTACSLLPKGCGGQQQPTGPAYFAVESNSAMAATAVQVGLSALVNKRQLTVFYDNNPATNPAGCQQGDCRRLIGLVIR